MLTIRRAQSADADAIASVHVASWRTTYPGMVPDRYLVGLSAPTYAASWRRLLQFREEGATFVADDDGDGDGDGGQGVVGFGSCGPQRSRLEGFGGEFYALYLYDYMQGQGIGRRLMAAMADALMSQGVTSACVWVLRENPSRWFYERLGGTRLAEHTIPFAGTTLIETAYGWHDLAPLARLSADPSLR